MRRLSAFGIILALTACTGGGGGGTSVPASTPTATPSPVPTGSAPQYARPKFTITVPRKGAARRKGPNFVSTHSASISIQLTSDTAGIAVGSLSPNPIAASLSNCDAGCTVAGPPSPVGTDDYTITTYDGPIVSNAVSGQALDTGTTSINVAQGQANTGTVTLEGIPAKLSIIGAGGAPPAGTALPANAFIVNAKDADNELITGTYATTVTVSDPDTNGDGSYLVTSSTCPSYPTGNTAQTGSSVQLTSETSSIYFCYGGIAENPVTITASATGATSGTAQYTPRYSAPVYSSGSGTPSTIVSAGPPPLVALIATTGLGSTGSATFTEAGWTGAPYDQQLTATPPTSCVLDGPFSDYATVTPSTPTAGAGTVFTVTTIASPTNTGHCLLTISDGVTSNTSTATLDTAYTTTSIGVNGKKR